MSLKGPVMPTTNEANELGVEREKRETGRDRTETYLQIIQLPLPATPDRIPQIIPLPLDPQRLVRMIMMQLVTELALAHDDPPHLHTELLLSDPPPTPHLIPNPNPLPYVSLKHSPPRKWDRIPIEIMPLRRAGDFQKRSGEVCV